MAKYVTKSVAEFGLSLARMSAEAIEALEPSIFNHLGTQHLLPALAVIPSQRWISVLKAGKRKPIGKLKALCAKVIAAQ